MQTETADDSALPLLSTVEARILGCLVEKQATTPEAYPLTANAAVLACNQKTSREPLMELESGEVGHALREMEQRGLVRSIHGARAQRYEHRFAQAYSLTARQVAVLALLLLRGPQTLAELHTRSERLSDFADVDELRQTLERLMQRSPTCVVKLERAPGQREDRYMHLLCGAVDASQYVFANKTAPAAEQNDLSARLDALEAEVAALRAALDELRASR